MSTAAEEETAEMEPIVSPAATILIALSSVLKFALCEFMGLPFDSWGFSMPCNRVIRLLFEMDLKPFTKLAKEVRNRTDFAKLKKDMPRLLNFSARWLSEHSKILRKDVFSAGKD